MSEQDRLVVFLLDDWRYALHLTQVARVVQMVEITPLPNAPPGVQGVVNLQGQVIPVFDIRGRFGLRAHEPGLDDHLIVARTTRRTVGLVADEVSDIADKRAADVAEASAILPRLGTIEGVLKLEDGLILIHDLERFLSLEEEELLDGALEARGGPVP